MLRLLQRSFGISVHENDLTVAVLSNRLSPEEAATASKLLATMQKPEGKLYAPAFAALQKLTGLLAPEVPGAAAAPGTAPGAGVTPAAADGAAATPAVPGGAAAMPATSGGVITNSAIFGNTANDQDTYGDIPAASGTVGGTADASGPDTRPGGNGMAQATLATAQPILLQLLDEAAANGPSALAKAVDPDNPDNAAGRAFRIALIQTGTLYADAGSGVVSDAGGVAGNGGEANNGASNDNNSLIDDESGAMRDAGSVVGDASGSIAEAGGEIPAGEGESGAWRSIGETTGKPPQEPESDFFDVLEEETHREMPDPPDMGTTFLDGLDDSIICLDLYGKEADRLTPEERATLPFLHRLARNLGTITGDAPAYTLGGIIGSGGGLPGVAIGAFGFVEGMRSIYLDKIRKGEIVDFNDFCDRLLNTTVQTGKGMANGGSLFLGGQATASVATGIGAKGASRAALIGAGESAAVTTVSAALEGRFPSAREYLDNAALLFTLKGAGRVAGKTTAAGKELLRNGLIDITEKTGVHPAQVVEAAKRDPAVLEFIENPEKPLPEALAAEIEKAVIYNDNRSVKVTFTDTGIEFSLTDKAQLKEYFGSLTPEEIKALKFKDPNQYLATLKSIVRKVFPDGGEIRYRQEKNLPPELGGERYEHLLKDALREQYIHTLPRTLKAHDVTMEFTTKEGAKKAYYIKKYFDPQVQKDIWDMLVIYNGEVQTKFVQKGGRAKYLESIIIKDSQ